MLASGSVIRALLAVAWCCLVGIGWFLSQDGAVTGNPLKVTDTAQIAVRNDYLAFLVLMAVLAIFDLARREAKRRLSQPPESLPPDPTGARHP